MPKHWFDFAEDWRSAPMAYWVHVPRDGMHWRDEAAVFDPPAPPGMPRGYPVLCIELRDALLWFSSPAQLQAFIETLSMKPLPSSRRLSGQRGSGHGPNSHWLSRLPAWMKGAGFREKTLPRIARLASEVVEGDRWKLPR